MKSASELEKVLEKVLTHYREYERALREEQQAVERLNKLFNEGKELLGLNREYGMTRLLGDHYLTVIGKLYSEIT